MHFLALCFLFMKTTATSPAPTDDAYRTEVERWRTAREARLRAADGWLTVVGLSWLHPGPNRFGGAPDDDVHLPPPVPPHAGTFVVTGDKVEVVLPAGSPLTIGGRPATSGVVRTDAEPTPDTFAMGPLTWQVIARGERRGVRVRDRDAPARATFPPPRWYPVAPAYRVVARLTPHAAPVEIVVPDASGGHQALSSPGTLALTLLGQPLRLDPVLDGDDPNDQLVVFRDLTSGHDTYGAGRFLRARRQADGTFVLDFNEAYSPPCAVTPHATCPLPPPQNRLRVSIEAGEKNRDDHGDGASHP